jgi:hypothetical protein
VGTCLVADIYHMGLALGIEMGQRTHRKS